MRDVVAQILMGFTSASLLFVFLLAARAEERSANVDENQIAMLVKQLGHEEYKTRELATAQLAQLGLATKHALTAALEHPDLEVRIRAKRLLSSVLADDFQRRLKEFAEDMDDSRDLDLPCWKKFKQAFGSEAAARKFFVAMQREEPALLEAAANGPRSAAEALNQRYNALQVGPMLNRYPVNRRGMSLETTAVLIFVASDPEVQFADNVATWIANIPRQNPFSQTVASGEPDDIPRRILSRWLAHPAAEKNVSVAQLNLNLAAQFNLPEALTPALQVIGSQTPVPFYRQQAILVIGKYGGKEHLSALEPFLLDTNFCGNLAVPNLKAPTAIQIRDVTLAVMVHLSGQEPKDYGYDYIQPNEQMLYQMHTVGFEDADKRDAALKKWQEWSAQKK